MSCPSGKQSYATEQLAEQALYMAIAYGEINQSSPKRTYYCLLCNRYHLTSQELRRHDEKENSSTYTSTFQRC